MTDERRRTGARAEDLACRSLQARGYKILERNVRAPFGEIDLVAQDGNTLVFVEVRSASSARFGAPQESVTQAKQTRLTRLAQWYLVTRRLSGRAARFDVVAVVFAPDGESARVDVIRDAFEGKGAF